MKILRTGNVIVLSLLALMVSGVTAHAQSLGDLKDNAGASAKKPKAEDEKPWVPGERMQRALVSVLASAKISQAKGYGFLDFGAFFGTFLRNGQRVEETFQLKAGVPFLFVVGGDDVSNKISVTVYDAAGKVVRKDNDTETAIVGFTPKKTERYKVVLRLEKSTSGAAFCAMSVLQKGGAAVRVDALTTALAPVLAVCEKMGREYEGIYFHDGDNTWAVYAAVVAHKASVSTDPKVFSGNQLVIASGDANASDVNVYITQGDKTVAKGRDLGRATVAMQHTEGKEYSIVLENAYSNGRAVLVTAILDVPDSVLEKIAAEDEKPEDKPAPKPKEDDGREDTGKKPIK